MIVDDGPATKQTRELDRLEKVMSDLNFKERRNLERLLDMGSGYLLAFSNRTFADFLAESIALDVSQGAYSETMGSKANRLRAIWKSEPNAVVAKLNEDLIDLAVNESSHSGNGALFEECRRCVARLRLGQASQHVDPAVVSAADEDFQSLAKSIRLAIDQNDPASGLDRLHTFVTKLLRKMCDECGLSSGKDEPLNSLLGKYVRHLKSSGKLEAEMTERLLKSNINILDGFNYVRNNRSMAHDNLVLGYDESLVILSYISSTVRYLQAVHRKSAKP